MSQLDKTRQYKFDNIRCLMVFLVVFGHLLETMPGGFLVDNLYRVIYSFHVPVLIFISGCFARFSRRKIVRGLLCPYIIFQTVYIVLYTVFYSGGSWGDVHLQFTVPHWILWYLLTLVFYDLLIPMIRTDDARIRLTVLSIAVILSLFAGYDERIGYDLSLSRFFTFWPFFICGYYSGHPAGRGQGNTDTRLSQRLSLIVFPERLSDLGGRRGIRPFKMAAVFAVAVSVSVILLNPGITRYALYGARSYAAAGYHPGIKFLLLIVAAMWLGFFVLWMPDKKMPIVSAVGRHSLPVYLLHELIVMCAGKYHWFRFSTAANLGLALLTAAAVILLFSAIFSAKDHPA